jgi:hypothetical protein
MSEPDSYIIERSRTVKPSSIVLLVGLVLALVPITGTLWAFAQGEGFDIHACVNPSGKIRIVDDVSMCRKQETELQWNIQGPPGEPAPPGLAVGLEYYTVRSPPALVNPGSGFIATAVCSPGDQVTGGGFNIQADNPGCVAVVWSMADGQDEWSVQVVNECDTEIWFLSQAVCVETP